MPGNENDLFRAICSFSAGWKELKESLCIENNLYALPDTVAAIAATLKSEQHSGTGLTANTLRDFFLGAFHRKRVPIDDEPGVTGVLVDRFCSSTWTVDDLSGTKRKCLMRAWSHLQGSLTIGFVNAVFPSNCEIVLTERSASGTTCKRTSLCISTPSHTHAPVVLRWRYCFAEMHVAVGNRGFSFERHGNKHFKLAHSNPIREDNTWISSTNPPNPALFMPGLPPESEEIDNLVKRALSAAFESGHYATEEVNGFIFDSGMMLGASNSKATTKIELYVTPQNELHIRPKN